MMEMRGWGLVPNPRVEKDEGHKDDRMGAGQAWRGGKTKAKESS